MICPTVILFVAESPIIEPRALHILNRRVPHALFLPDQFDILRDCKINQFIGKRISFSTSGPNWFGKI